MTPDDAERRRRRREDLFRPLVSALVGATIVIAVLSWGLLHVSLDVSSVADEASATAKTAVTNTDRIAAVEHNACARLQRVRSAVNRNGAIIYVVLGAVSGNVKKAGNNKNAREYRVLGQLPQYDPTINCDEAADPGFKQPDPIPYTKLSREKFLELLPAYIIDRILGPKR